MHFITTFVGNGPEEREIKVGVTYCHDNVHILSAKNYAGVSQPTKFSL